MTQTTSELHYLTIRQAADMLREKKLSPVELTQAFLGRIQQLDDTLEAYITVLPDTAMAEARRAEAEILLGEYRGSLHGIPIALKDLYDTAGIRTTASSRIMADRVPDRDATAAARLKAAGTILLGKLCTHEFAAAGPDPTNGFPTPRNPWNVEHVTGGSSSGGAAAVAAGLCMGTLGTCTTGSVRSPASQCGITGLKPTYGRVSRYGVIPLSWTMDHCGPMTWTVEDAAILLQAVAGYDPMDPTSSRAPVPDYTKALRESVKGLKIGVPKHYFFADDPGIDGETLSAVEAALKTFERLGAHVEEVRVPALAYSDAAQAVIYLSEAFAYHEKDLRTRSQEFGERVRNRFRIGALFTSNEYVQAQRARKALQSDFAQVLQTVDVVVGPTRTRPAPRFDEIAEISYETLNFAAPFNLTGMPAISVPCGFTSGGLPIGLQIAGRPFDEATVLRAAYAYEQHARWSKKRPLP